MHAGGGNTPPLFAVLAHGMAAVAFWRAGLLLKLVSQKVQRIKPMSTLIRVIRSIR